MGSSGAPQEPFRSGCPLAARGVGFAAAAFKASSTAIRDRLLDCPTKFDCARMRIGERHGIAIAAAIMPKLAGRELIATVLLRSVHVRAWCDPSVRSVGLNVIVFDRVLSSGSSATSSWGGEIRCVDGNRSVGCWKQISGLILNRGKGEDSHARQKPG